ncbi:uncharacterized protein FRV6_16619 [Fusarium oxysporum]|uniref:Uncharacterized protein n=1 Tax=Fusarium oxysporum TaxID=5507 RepID=A0A2H3U3E8_FUSOX|nr:uncharacterized protein FRV6_16619 [Fusarium oxysporum]
MSFFLDAAPYLETAESGIKESGDDYVCTILQWDHELDGHRIPFGQPEDDKTPYVPQWISSAFVLRAEFATGPNSSDADGASEATTTSTGYTPGTGTPLTSSTRSASHQAGHNETPQCNVTLICFETSPEVQNELETLVRELKMKEILHHPSILWEIIMYHLSMALDAELWRLTEVFKTEQRTLGYLTARPSKALSEIDFSALHLLADHMVLVLEGARGLLATIDGLIDHHESSIGSSPGFLARKTRDALKYRRRYVQSIVERGTTFDKRISNMISLFFSHVSLQDSGLMMRDSSSLRSIALITLIFLPITTVATICGSAFFYMAEHDDGSQSVQMDSSSWSMFFVSGVATIILIGVWTFQLQSLQRQFTRGRITPARNTGNVPLVV